jgi:antitoxin ParD1/3/4
MYRGAEEDPTMATLTVELTDDLRAFVEEQSVREGYESPGDFVVDIIQKAYRRDERRRRVEKLLLDGLNSGEATPLDAEEWASIRREVEERLSKERGNVA